MESGRRRSGKDLVDEIVEERSRKNPDFPELVEAALRTRRLVRALTERRREMGISQTIVAARMGTSQSALARLEAGGSDPRISTLERYARALGEEFDCGKRTRSVAAGPAELVARKRPCRPLSSK